MLTLTYTSVVYTATESISRPEWDSLNVSVVGVVEDGDIWMMVKSSTKNYSTNLRPSFIPGFFCCRERIDTCFFLSVTYFCHFPGLLFQVCGSEGDTVLLAEAVFFYGL